MLNTLILFASNGGYRLRPRIGLTEVLIGVVLTLVVFGVIALVARKLESKS